MASMWRKAMLYLGLGPDDEYDDFDATGEHPVAPHSGPPRSSGRRSGSGSAQRDPEPSGSVRTLAPGRHVDDRNGNGHGHAADEDLTGDASRGRGAGATRRGSDVDRTGRGRSGIVRPLAGATTKPFVVGPASFNDAQDVADKFKVNVPVILNLQGVDRDLSRR
ncbi:MAG: cell division protein SepF, partial [Acidimicrobiales bacterium]